MIHNNDIQEAVVAALKADAPLVALTTEDEIREAEWQGKEFKYPNVRVLVLHGPPKGEGPCIGKTRKVSFLTAVASTDSSSKECSKVAAVVADALNGKQLTSDAFQSGTVRLRDYPGALFEIAAEAWELDLTWEVNVYG